MHFPLIHYAHHHNHSWEKLFSFLGRIIICIGRDYYLYCIRGKHSYKSRAQRFATKCRFQNFVFLSINGNIEEVDVNIQIGIFAKRRDEFRPQRTSHVMIAIQVSAQIHRTAFQLLFLGIDNFHSQSKIIQFIKLLDS